MKILSMTATFGKLSRQTLTLDEGLNIIDRPNEWGKSTWCAFLMAMLYGIDTREQTKNGHLAVKEHYKPWSGEPMSGSMDILWDGRKITIQRQNTARTPLGEVKAFETETGIPVEELCVPAPGQVLLGVEKSVFARAGFLKLSEMPVEDDEALRRRLNALVTTGDESGASDALAKKLNDLNNKCSSNSKKGLIPEAEATLKNVNEKLEKLRQRKDNVSEIKRRQVALTEQERLLQNHKQALRYNEQKQYAEKLIAAQNSHALAEQALAVAEADCENLPAEATIRQSLAQLQQLRDDRESLRTKNFQLPPVPPVPETLDAFRGKDPEKAVAEAKQDMQRLQELKTGSKNLLFFILGFVAAVAGAGLLLLSQMIPAVICFGCGVACFVLGASKKKSLQQQIIQLQDKYRGVSPDHWEKEAQNFADTRKRYKDELDNRQRDIAVLNQQLEENEQAIAAITGTLSLSQYEETCRNRLQKHADLLEKRRALQNAEDVLQALSGAGEQVQPPMFEDALMLSREETEQSLAEIATEKRNLERRLGEHQGEMNALGSEESLQTQKDQIENRIAMLKKYKSALNRAQKTLEQAILALQRRFAPRISSRAKELFSLMTGGRYQRLILKPDLSVDSGAADEIGEQNTLWRSDGTVDQLYLALRLAVAEELTPDAPLILDDALVRFDDVRLDAALQILKEASAQKQILLFTCQSREKRWEETV